MSEAHSADIHDEPQHLLQVAGIMFVSEDGYVLVSERPSDKRYPFAWQVPGGKCEPHESPQQGALRELLEETGIVIPIEDLGSPFTQVTIEEHGHDPYEAFVFRVKIPMLEQAKFTLKPQNREAGVKWIWRQLNDMMSRLRSYDGQPDRVIIPGLVEALTKAEQEWNEEETARWKARGEFEKWSWYQHTFFHTQAPLDHGVDHLLFQREANSGLGAPGEATNLQQAGIMMRPFIGTGISVVLRTHKSEVQLGDWLQYMVGVRVGESQRLTIPLELFRSQGGDSGVHGVPSILRFDFDLTKDMPGSMPFDRPPGWFSRPKRDQLVQDIQSYWPLVIPASMPFSFTLRTRGLVGGMRVSAYLHGYEAREWV